MAHEEGALAKRSLTLTPLWYLALFTFLTGAGMIGAALVDVALMVNVMSAGFSDAFGRTTEHLSLWFGSGVMLICYWGLGVLFDKGGHARRLAYVGYIGMVLVIGSLLFPVQSAKFTEIWSSFGGADPFGGGQQSEPPHALLVFLVTINAILYTGPGLFFVWTKGRFAHWIERCRNRSQARKQERMADEAAEESEIMHRSAFVIDALHPEQQARMVQAALRQGLSIYAATVENKATAAKAIRADVASTKTAKHQAEIDHGAAVMCRNSLQKINL
jgi:hypothetical protein